MSCIKMCTPSGVHVTANIVLSLTVASIGILFGIPCCFRFDKSLEDGDS